MNETENSLIEEKAIEFINSELIKSTPKDWQRMVEKFVLAALGSIPWVGGFISAAVSYKTDEKTIKANNLQTKWLQEHSIKIENLMKDLEEVVSRFEGIGEQIDKRIQTDEYLSLVRKAFRTWNEADTDEKRKYVKNIVANSAGTTVCSDDVIRLFIDWLNSYHEAHFAVIREIYKQPGITRYDMWANLNGEFPREDSPEADLFKMLIRDLSMGGVIRQERTTNHYGQFVKKKPVKRNTGSNVMESAFETTKPYVLTGLGEQFVHYTMNEVVNRIE